MPRPEASPLRFEPHWIQARRGRQPVGTTSESRPHTQRLKVHGRCAALLEVPAPELEQLLALDRRVSPPQEDHRLDRGAVKIRPRTRKLRGRMALVEGDAVTVLDEVADHHE